VVDSEPQVGLDELDDPVIPREFRKVTQKDGTDLRSGHPDPCLGHHGHAAMAAVSLSLKPRGQPSGQNGPCTNGRERGVVVERCQSSEDGPFKLQGQPPFGDESWLITYLVGS
jgi:hypothetical protein